MLDVNRFVMFATPDTSELPRLPRELRLIDEIAGAVRAERGWDRREQRAEHVGEPGRATPPNAVRVDVTVRELRRCFPGVERERAAVAVGGEVPALREHVVAVLGELELAQDRRWHEAHDVRQRGHLEVGAPRLLGDRRAADLRTALEHDDARAPLGEQTGGDEPVVASADDDDVERIGHELPNLLGRTTRFRTPPDARRPRLRTWGS